MIKFGVRRPTAVAVVLVATAAVLPASSHAAADPAAADRAAAGLPPEGYQVAFPCEVTTPQTGCSFSWSLVPGPQPEPSWPSEPARPTGLATDGLPGCVTGPGRPVTATTTPTMTATFTGAAGRPIDATFELEPLDGSDDPVWSSVTVPDGEPVIMEQIDTGLRPGVSYRWRVHAAYLSAEPFTGAPVVERENPAPLWSAWCEFTVAAGLLDLTGATDVEAVRELGVDPARRYAVTLPVRQWRLLLDCLSAGGEQAPDDFGDYDVETAERLRRMTATIRRAAAGRAASQRSTVMLTGDEWASTLTEAVIWAAALDQTAEEEQEAVVDGAPYWRVVDRISTAVGGPPHPSLGYDR
jgi:hypothetical protein